MEITWTTKEHGREGELLYLNRKRNDYALPGYMRLQADRAHQTIVAQLHDKKLMSLRDRLIKAAKAHDEYEQHKIQLLMRDHEGQEKETGLEY